MLLFFISFIAGVLTVLAPCVLPLLPIIVGGSISTGSMKRAYTICVSLGVSVIAFTLLLKVSTAFIAVPQSFWDVLSGGILILFGVVLIFPRLWDNLGFVNTLNRSSNRALALGYQKNSLWGDVLMGAALGPVFTSCSPTYFIILATVLPASFALGMVDLLAYAVGLSGFLLLIAVVGQTLVDTLGVAIEPGGWFRKAIGVLFILVGIGIFTGVEAQAEVWLADRGFDVTSVEQRLLGVPNASSLPNATVGTTPDTMTDTMSSTTEMDASSSDALSAEAKAPSFLTSAEKALLYPKAPELVMPDGYINTGIAADGSAKPITIGQFKGKSVVLVDFWTYSCINCIRTIPYVESWYKKYKDQGLVIIGVHTPEFAFEHVYDNVAAAVQKFGITYPVVQDNEYRTWGAFANQFWPREYLVDIDGYIVHDHAGEGDYDGTEAAIQKALAERAARLGQTAAKGAMSDPSNAIAIDFNKVGSPETYFGSSRNEYLGNGTQHQDGTQTLSIPSALSPNTLYLGGTWNFVGQYAQNTSAGAQIRFLYNAKNVYFVAAPASGSVKIKVTHDGGQSLGAAAGSDVSASGEVTIDSNRLYQLVGDSSYGVHTLEIEVESAGLQAYTFTFG